MGFNSAFKGLSMKINIRNANNMGLPVLLLLVWNLMSS